MQTDGRAVAVTVAGRPGTVAYRKPFTLRLLVGEGVECCLGTPDGSKAPVARYRIVAVREIGERQEVEIECELIRNKVTIHVEEASHVRAH